MKQPELQILLYKINEFTIATRLVHAEPPPWPHHPSHHSGWWTLRRLAFPRLAFPPRDGGERGGEEGVGGCGQENSFITKEARKKWQSSSSKNHSNSNHVHSQTTILVLKEYRHNQISKKKKITKTFSLFKKSWKSWISTSSFYCEEMTPREGEITCLRPHSPPGLDSRAA